MHTIASGETIRVLLGNCPRCFQAGIVGERTLCCDDKDRVYSQIFIGLDDSDIEWLDDRRYLVEPIGLAKMHGQVLLYPAVIGKQHEVRFPHDYEIIHPRDLLEGVVITEKPLEPEVESVIEQIIGSNEYRYYKSQAIGFGIPVAFTQHKLPTVKDSILIDNDKLTEKGKTVINNINTANDTTGRKHYDGRDPNDYVTEKLMAATLDKKIIANSEHFLDTVSTDKDGKVNVKTGHKDAEGSNEISTSVNPGTIEGDIEGSNSKNTE